MAGWTALARRQLGQDSLARWVQEEEITVGIEGRGRHAEDDRDRTPGARGKGHNEKEALWPESRMGGWVNHGLNTLTRRTGELHVALHVNSQELCPRWQRSSSRTTTGSLATPPP